MQSMDDLSARIGACGELPQVERLYRKMMAVEGFDNVTFMRLEGRKIMTRVWQHASR